MNEIQLDYWNQDLSPFPFAVEFIKVEDPSTLPVMCGYRMLEKTELDVPPPIGQGITKPPDH